MVQCWGRGTEDAPVWAGWGWQPHAGSLRTRFGGPERKGHRAAGGLDEPQIGLWTRGAVVHSMAGGAVDLVETESGCEIGRAWRSMLSWRGWQEHCHCFERGNDKLNAGLGARAVGW